MTVLRKDLFWDAPLEGIDPEHLDLLRRLVREPGPARFFLVGWTALALHLGHRLSVDFDEAEVEGEVAALDGTEWDRVKESRAAAVAAL